jgi:zinc transport system substrate-binding protein
MRLVARGLAVAGILMGILTASCSGRLSGNEPPLRIVVSIPPLAGLVRPLAPEGSEIKVLIPPGRSEHGYEMTSDDFAAAGRAHVLVYIGLGLEPRVEEFVKERRSRGRTDLSFAAAVKIDGAAGGHEHDHEHGDDGHAHGPVDPHLWLDPVLVEQFVPALRAAIDEAMVRRGIMTPEAKARLDAAARDLEAKVRAVHDESLARLGEFAGRPIVTHHAAWGRLAERYNLRVAAVLRPIETSEPTPSAIAAVIEAVKREGVTTIFIEPQFDRSTAKKVADATGVRVCTLDPIGDGDWFAMMRRNIQVLESCLGEKTMIPPGREVIPPAPVSPEAPRR